MERQITLGDVIAPAKVLRCDNDDYPVLSMTMHDGIVLQSDRFKKSLASIDQSNYKVVLRGQLVVGFPIDEGVIYVQNITEAGIMSPAYGVWNIYSKEIMPEYLELCLHSPQSMDYYKNKLRGTTARRRSITTGDLLALPITLPSLTEQKRRISLLKQATLLLNSQKQAMLKFDELVKSRFVEMFGEPLKNAKGWIEAPLIEVAPIRQLHGLLQDEVWLLNLDAIESQTGVILFKQRVPVSEINASTVYFTVDSVLYSKLRPYLNKVVTPDENGIATSELLPMYPIPNKLNRAYLCHWLRSDAFVKHISEKVAGAKMPRVAMDYFRTLSIELPPLELQNRFAVFVSEVDKSKLSYEMEVAA